MDHLNQSSQTNTKQGLIDDLCQEVDDLKRLLAQHIEQLRLARHQYALLQKQHHDHVNKTVTQALLLTLSLREGAEGSLVISKENREGILQMLNLETADKQQPGLPLFRDQRVQIRANDVRMVVSHNNVGLSVDYYYASRPEDAPFKEDQVWWEDFEPALTV